MLLSWDIARHRQGEDVGEMFGGLVDLPSTGQTRGTNKLEILLCSIFRQNVKLKENNLGLSYAKACSQLIDG